MFGLNIYAMVGAAVLIAALTAAIYVQHKWSVEELAKKEILIVELQVELTASKIETESLKTSLEFMNNSLDIQREEREVLDKKISRSEREVRRLEKLFDDHDLPMLSARKPGLVEKLINKGSDEALKDLENITKNKGDTE